jgi:hypothetical protein
MEVIQYGDKFAIVTDEGDVVESGFLSRYEAVEARERMTSDAVVAMDDDEAKPKRGRKVK